MAQEHPDALAYLRTADAFRAGDLDAVESLISPDVVWRVPRARPGWDDPRARGLLAPLGSRGSASGLSSTARFRQATPTCAVSTMGARRSDVDVQTRAVSVFRYEDGRQVERWTPTDTAAWNAEIFTA